jgi:hypothetical protein
MEKSPAPAAQGGYHKGVIHVTCSELRRALARLKPTLAHYREERLVNLTAGDGAWAAVETRSYAGCARIELDAKVHGDVDVLLEHKQLAELTRPFNKLETLSLRPNKDGGLQVRSGRATYTLQGVVRWRNTWPPDPVGDAPISTIIHAEGHDLAQTIGHVAGASGDAEQGKLHAIHLRGERAGEGVAVASDTLRLLEAPLPGVLCRFDLTVGLLLVEALRGLREGEGCKLSVTQKADWTVLERDSECWTIRNELGPWTNWRELFDLADQATIELDGAGVEELKHALRAVEALKAGIDVECSVTAKGYVRLSATVPDVGSAGWRGRARVRARASQRVRVKGAFLRQLLDAMPGPEFTITFTDRPRLLFESNGVRGLLAQVKS